MAFSRPKAAFSAFACVTKLSVRCGEAVRQRQSPARYSTRRKRGMFRNFRTPPRKNRADGQDDHLHDFERQKCYSTWDPSPAAVAVG